MEWAIPVVNVQWLNDVALGVNDSMKKPYGTNPKHKIFDLKEPLDIADTLSIRDIMIGWMHPIKVSEEELNKALERKKLEESSRVSIDEKEVEINKESDDDIFAKPPAKKMRVGENVAPDQIKKSEDSILPPPPPLTLAPFATVPFKVMITGLDKKEKVRLEGIVKRLGAKCTTKFPECTHLIAEGAIRTVKFLCALNHATYVVSKSWLLQSDQNNSFISESGHEIQDVKPALSKRRERGEKMLLDKKVIYITPGCIPSPSILHDLVNSSGGVPVTTRGPTANQMERMKQVFVQLTRLYANTSTFLQSGLEFMILTKKETDLHLIERYLACDVPCLSPEWLLSSISAQDLCPYTDFRISSE